MTPNITITNEMATALEIVQNTNESIYITGKAGTGKTTFLKYLVENINKRFIITAPTGVAAVNAGGITLHSFLNIPFGPLGPTAASDSKFFANKKYLANCIDVLIIDEISMVRADVMDFIDKKLRMYRQNAEPFGGIQLVMFGDLHQLPPVVKADEREFIESMYRGPYFFNASVFREKGFRVIELTHIFRQTDENFITILNHIRNYQLTFDDLQILSELRNKELSTNFDSKHIHICSHRQDVANINRELLGIPTNNYDCKMKGDFPEANAPCDTTLSLRVGARVMTLVNDKEGHYYNGSLGVVEELGEKSILVQLDNGYLVEIGPYIWEQCEYKAVDTVENGLPVKKIERVVKGTCEQFPLALAWAITIHKSQGLTFDNIVIHSKGMFCPGQLYVALSRCRTLEGIASESFITKRMIFPDYELTAFEKAYKANNNIFDRHAYHTMSV